MKIERKIEAIGDQMFEDHINIAKRFHLVVWFYRSSLDLKQIELLADHVGTQTMLVHRFSKKSALTELYIRIRIPWFITNSFMSSCRFCYSDRM